MSNKIIPKEQLSAYQRWELNSLDESAARAVAAPEPEPEPAVALPTAKEIEQIYQQAYQDGLATGYQEGKGRAEGEAQRLAQLANGLTEALEQFDQQMAQDVLTLALDVSKQMLRQALKVHPELLLPVIREAMATLPQANPHPHLILHPEDAALVRSFMEEEIAHFHWRIVEDGKMARGGCRLETSNSEIDATMEQRWNRVLATLGRDDQWLA